MQRVRPSLRASRERIGRTCVTKYVELHKAKPLDSPFLSFGQPRLLSDPTHMRQFSKGELQLNHYPDWCVSLTKNMPLLLCQLVQCTKHQHKGVGLVTLCKMTYEM